MLVSNIVGTAVPVTSEGTSDVIAGAIFRHGNFLQLVPRWPPLVSLSTPWRLHGINALPARYKDDEQQTFPVRNRDLEFFGVGSIASGGLAHQVATSHVRSCSAKVFKPFNDFLLIQRFHFSQHQKMVIHCSRGIFFWFISMCFWPTGEGDRDSGSSRLWGSQQLTGDLKVTRFPGPEFQLLPHVLLLFLFAPSTKSNPSASVSSPPPNPLSFPLTLSSSSYTSLLYLLCLHRLLLSFFFRSFLSIVWIFLCAK